MYTTSLTDVTANKVSALVTLLILTEPPGSQMPSKVFASTASGPLTGSMSITSPYNNSTIGCTNLIHGATLQCFNFLKHDVNPISVAATLRYLAWVLPFAAQSVELEGACNSQEVFAHIDMGDAVLSKLAQKVAIAMKDYREKLVNVVYC